MWEILNLSSCFSDEYLFPVSIEGVALAPSETRSREIMRILEIFQGALIMNRAPFDRLLPDFTLGSD